MLPIVTSSSFVSSSYGRQRRVALVPCASAALMLSRARRRAEVAWLFVATLAAVGPGSPLMVAGSLANLYREEPR